jgi:hypothetical protein
MISLAAAFFVSLVVFSLSEFPASVPLAAAEAARRDIERDAGLVQDFLRDLEARFSASLREGAVRRSFLPQGSAKDISERSRLYAALLTAQKGLRWVRFVDAGGARIHFSTYSPDIQSQSGGRVLYRNYNTGTREIPFEILSASGGGAARIVPDEDGEGFVFSLPFYDALDRYRGSALFFLSLEALPESLTGEGSVNAGKRAAFLRSPPGIVLGLPAGAGDALVQTAASLWRLQLPDLSFVDPRGAALISSRTDQGFYVGRIVEGLPGPLPPSAQVVLKAAFFCTVFLTVFLLLNFRQDAMTIVKNRVCCLQAAIIDEYHSAKRPQDWESWSRQFDLRRETLRRELKRGFRLRKHFNARRLDAEIDTYINNALAGLEELLKKETPGVEVRSAARPETVTRTQAPAADFSRPPGPAVKGGEIEEITFEKEKITEMKDYEYKNHQTNEREIPEDPCEMEELEELEEAWTQPAESSSGDYSSFSAEDIDALAREIEFTPLPDGSIPDLILPGGNIPDLEIVSPFDTILSELNAPPRLQGSGSPQEKELPGTIKIQENAALDPDAAETARQAAAIVSWNGVSYINPAAIEGEGKAPPDKDFQSLVNSVLKSDS